MDVKFGSVSSREWGNFVRVGDAVEFGSVFENGGAGVAMD
jgi:hypothetical protein